MYSILSESAAAVLSKQDSLHSKNISQAFDEGAAAMQVKETSQQIQQIALNCNSHLRRNLIRWPTSKV